MEAEMDETVKRRVEYRVQREVMDEFKVDELAEKADVHTSLSDKVKDAVR